MERFELQRFEKSENRWMVLVRAENWDTIYHEFDRRKNHPVSKMDRFRIVAFEEVQQTRAEYIP